MNPSETSGQQLSDGFRPKTQLAQPEALSFSKSRLETSDPSLAPAFAAVMRHAQEALACKSLSVTQNDSVPTSGDKHDYYSMAPYWWPNPESKDGFPYVHRDGKINPAVLAISDKPLIEAFSDQTLYLAYAYYFTDDERFAQAAAEFIRVWFLNKDTRMNPHLNFAQGIPGRVNGRDFGVIEGIPFRHVIEAVGLIEHSSAWTKDNHEDLREWMDAYLYWLMTNSRPRKTRNLGNNQGTYCDVQIVSIALFLGQQEIAADVCEMVKKARIKYQIMPDGTQPEELARTNPLLYCAFNLKGLCELALYAERVGVDLWNFSTPDGRSICKAADWLLPRLAGEIHFERKETGPFYPQSYMAIFRLPAIKYRDAKYERYWEIFQERIDDLVFFDGPKEKQDAPDEQLDNLLFPKPDFTKEEMAKAELDIKEAVGNQNVDLFNSIQRVFLANAARLVETKARIAAGDKRYLPAYKALVKRADKALDMQPLSVTSKTRLAPSGDPHDYLSYALNWWPNPDTSNGLLWVKLKNKRNPSLMALSDQPKLDKLSRSVQDLAYAYYFSEDTRYAEYAARLLRTWFTDKDTKMNPHLKFAKIVPGTDIGNSFGIIDAACLQQIVDAVGLLRSSKAWTRADHDIFKEWTRLYTFWLLTSKTGRKVRKATDSHGTFADLQILSLALCAGQYELAERLCESSKRVRIARQIAPSGKLPAELKRSHPLHYAARNLTALFHLALYAEEVNVDLWNFSTKSGRSLRKAADWFYSAISQRTGQVRPENYFMVFRLASEKFNDPKFERFLNQLDQLHDQRVDALISLLYPPSQTTR